MSRIGKSTERGFSMVELMVVVGLIMVIGVMATVKLLAPGNDGRADEAMDFVTGQLRVARGMAISQRHYIQVAFNGTNQMQLTRVETGGALTPLLGAGAGTPWEGPAVYKVLAPVDTPMGFGNGAAVLFTNTVTGAPVAGVIEFTPGGQLVDAGTLAPVKGTVFVGLTGNVGTARAVTVMGNTGRVREYHWTTGQWTE